MRLKTALPWLLCVLLAGLWVAHMPWPTMLRGQNDFIQLYEGGRLAGSGQLYSTDAALAVQREVLGHTSPNVLYIRLPLYAWLMKPLAALPYQTAQLIWQAVNLAALAFFVWRFRSRLPTLPLFVLTSTATWSSIGNCQDIPLALLGAALCVEALEERRDRAAGLWLGLCLVKFHLFLLVPAALLALKRFRAIAWASGVTLSVIALSTVLEGPDIWRDYLRAILDLRGQPEGYTLPSITGIRQSLQTPPWSGGVFAAVFAVIYLWSIWKLPRALPGGVARPFALALAGSILLNHHVYVQDLAMLFLPLVLLAPAPRLFACLAFLCSPLAGFLLFAPGAWGILVPITLAALPVIASWPLREPEKHIALVTPEAA